MVDMQQRVEAFEETQKTYYTTIKSITQQLATSIVNETLTSFSQQIEHIIQQQYTTVDKDLSQMVYDMLQDVSAVADEAHTQLQRSVEETMVDFKEKLASEGTKMKHDINLSSSNQPPLKSNRFPHVTLDSTFRRLPNPYDTTASLPDTTYCCSPPTFHDPSYKPFLPRAI
jgi:Na+-transporting NADH:ubiquinone oxidoreductase subunit NqrC